MKDKIYIVTRSPWPVKLPNGTLIKESAPRPGKEGEWFERTDGKPVFEEGEEPDNKFKLFSDEYEKA